MKHSRLPGQSHRSIRTPQIRSWVTLTLPSLPTPTIIAGDLNANPWSSGMQQLVAAELHRATSLQPTWPSALPVIPIDQIVTSEHWSLIEAGVGPDFGSDHRPAFARVAPLPKAH